jgi:hypothetical protein
MRGMRHKLDGLPDGNLYEGSRLCLAAGAAATNLGVYLQQNFEWIIWALQKSSNYAVLCPYIEYFRLEVCRQ